MSFYSGFAPCYEQIFPFREGVYSFLREYAPPPCGIVLDAGCGTGHYCGRFFCDGYRVTGIDLDPKMIEVASANWPEVSFRCMDISSLGSLQPSFHLIYSIGNVLAHLPSSGLPSFLSTVYDALESGGFWIMQVVNWDYLLTQGEYTFPVKIIDNGTVEFHRRYPLVSPEEAVFEVELSRQGKTLFRERSRLYPVTSERYLRLHGEAGFVAEGLYPGFEKAEFMRDRNSGLVMVFRKP